MERFCAACGAAVEVEGRYCPHCGAALDDRSATQAEEPVPTFLQGERPGPRAPSAPAREQEGERVLPFAGFGRRFGAWFVDFLIFRAIWFAFVAVTGVGAALPGLDIDLMHPGEIPFDMETLQEVMQASARLTLVQMLIWWTYMTLFTGLMGQTPGKMAWRIRVVDAAGEIPGLARAFAREVVGKTVSQVVLFLGFLWILFDPRRQGWHDKIAGTFVVADRVEEARGLAVR